MRDYSFAHSDQQLNINQRTANDLQRNLKRLGTTGLIATVLYYVSPLMFDTATKAEVHIG
jgi:hypothetical protein